MRKILPSILVVGLLAVPLAPLIGAIALAGTGGSVTTTSGSTGLLQRQNTFVATQTIDGTNSNTPGLSFTNFNSTDVILWPNGNQIGSTSGLKLLWNSTSLQLVGGNFDQNGNTFTNTAASNGGDVAIASGKSVRLLGVGGLFKCVGSQNCDLNSLSGQNVRLTAGAAVVFAGSDTGATSINAPSGQNISFSTSGGGSLQLNAAAIDQTFCVPSQSLGATADASPLVLGQTAFTAAATADTGSKVTQAIAGTGAGNWVVMACTDGTTCAAGNQRLTYTEACTAAANTATAATVQNSGTIAAAATLTVSVQTACTNRPAATVCVHYHY